MTGINHLQLAKQAAALADKDKFHAEVKAVLWAATTGLALIAIAEQLEKMNNKNDISTRWDE